MSSSGSWLRRQANDVFVRRAKAEGYRARSAYKLIEMDERFKLIRPGNVIAECGASPGAWTQVAAMACNAQGFYDSPEKSIGGIVVGCDLLDIEPVKGAVLFRKSDFTDPFVQKKMINATGGKRFDVVLSDMAPNASGCHSLDSQSIVRLALLAMRFALVNSRPGASFVTKLWDSVEEREAFCRQAERFYDKVLTCKPQASRKESSEMYVVAKGFKGLKRDTTVQHES